ncbi:unnamed protein product [Lactuca saligna]|uniref:Uncharacterized protein n=1 Tax=Lactuca saligna TaxID=75948 RepID=A0AA35ZBS4_LACSI|nr:unnamed protein product [Lactuca saligna]
MLNRIGQQCQSVLRLPFPTLSPATLILTKSSSLLSAESLELEPSTTSPAANGSFPSGIISLFKVLGSSGVKLLGVKHRFKTLVSDLNSTQVDEIIDQLRNDDPDSAVELFELLKNEYGFKHSRVSQLVVAHVLASQRRLKLLRSNFMQMLQEEGSGSSSSLCELLSVNFKDWKSNAIVWDILAFAYSRSNMVHDALCIIAKMKDFNIQPSILTYNSLLHNLRHSDSMWDVYNDIKESGIQESKQTNSILVDGLCKQSLMQEAITLLHVKDSSPHVASFNTVMSSFSKMGFVDIAQSIFCLMLKFGVKPDAYTYNILINGLCIAGSIQDALKLTNGMVKHGVNPDSITYNTLAKGFHVLGKINGASKMIQETLSKGLKNPNSITYTLLICGNCQEGKVDESINLKNEMVFHGCKLNFISYSVLVSSLCKIGRVDEALCLLYEMEIDGLKPDVVMYSIIIHGFCKQGEIQKAIQVYMEMSNNRIFPNVFTHRAVLLGICGSGSVFEARKHFDMLISSDDIDIQDIVLYNIMINKYAKLGMNRESKQLFDQIIEKGIDPTIVTFNSLIYGFCKARDLIGAMRSFHNIEDHGLVPNAITYTTLMNFFCEEGNMQKVFDMKKEMEDNGVDPTHVTYTVIIKSLCKQKKLQESLSLINHMFSNGIFPDEVSYNILIQSLCKAREIEKAFELHDEMMSHNLKPDAVTYNILMNGLCVYGDLHDADKLFLYLREHDFELKKAAYTILVKAHCVKGDVDRAMEVFSEMVEMGFEVSVRDYSGVINRLCKRCLTYEAKGFLRMMFNNGVVPDIRVYIVMMYAFHVVGDVHSIHELLPNMVKCGIDSYVSMGLQNHI